VNVNAGEAHTTTDVSTSRSGTEGIASSQNPISENKKGKQKRKNDEDDDDDGTGDHREFKRPKNFLSSPVDRDDKKKFACPYRKNNPCKYRSGNKHWRSCAITPLENVARVK